MIVTYPAKKAANANVAYNAAFEFALVPESTCPPAPSPFKALKRPLSSGHGVVERGFRYEKYHLPGHIKQTKPSIVT